MSLCIFNSICTCHEFVFSRFYKALLKHVEIMRTNTGPEKNKWSESAEYTLQFLHHHRATIPSMLMFNEHSIFSDSDD